MPVTAQPGCREPTQQIMHRSVISGNSMRHFVLFTVLLAITTIAPAADQIFKWQDDQGQTHYTATPPPPGHTGELLRIDTRSSAPERARPPTPPATTATGEQPSAPDPIATAAKASAEQCDVARRNLAVLEQGGADRRFQMPDGSITRLTPAALQEKIASNQEFLDSHCSN